MGCVLECRHIRGHPIEPATAYKLTDLPPEVVEAIKEHTKSREVKELIEKNDQRLVIVFSWGGYAPMYPISHTYFFVEYVQRRYPAFKELEKFEGYIDWEGIYRDFFQRDIRELEYGNIETEEGIVEFVIYIVE